MSKLSSAVTAFALVILLCLSSALVAGQSQFSWSQIPLFKLANQVGAGTAPGKKTGTTAAEVSAATEEVLAQVSKLRGLKVQQPVKSGVKSRKEIEQIVIHDFDDSITPAETEAANKTMIAFGLVSKDFQYREFMIRLLTEQVAGFYEPKTKEFFLADWNPLELQKPVMAHELTHALQDQHFNLRRFEKWPKGDGDRELAIHALIEGDATALMIEYFLRPLGQDITKIPLSALKMMTSQTDSPGMAVFSSAPKSIRNSLVFPYGQGAIFSQAIIKESGWNGLSQAYTDLPQSTEQVLHPIKYIRHEMPVKVQLADLTSLLDKSWKRLVADINGEYGYYLVLSEFLNQEQSETASAGWGGDQYALYENASGKLLLAHLSTWDSENEADEFFRAYLARSKKRYSDFKEIASTSDLIHRAQTGEGEMYVERRGASVLVIEGYSGEGTKPLNQMTAKLWQSQIERKS